ncbi:MAG TPA: Rpn family recombination-promoting nuclease/putative transposase [Polyangiales bacterium]|nr:Rpn family recombination-promoting nuclease/putative transposase [Polyangiales bacterium]
MSKPSEPGDDNDAHVVAQPHDALFRRTFSDPVHVAGELRAVLPPALVARVDFTTLEVLPSSFVDETLRAKESDLLLSARFHQGHPALIYILCEHQSRADPRMPLRLLGYLTRIWEKHVESHPEVGEPLPAIVPLVVHHDRRPWSAPTRLGELFRLDPATHALLAPYIPDFTFVLDDLAAITPAELHARQTLSALAKLVLFALQRARHAARLAAELTAFAETVDELLQTPRGLDDWKVVSYYILMVANESTAQLREALRDAKDPRAREVIMSTAQRLFAEGRSEGLAEGRNEGLAEGRKVGLAEGRAAALGKLLSIKFGPLSAQTEALLYASTLAELERWTEQVLSATSLEDALR